MNPTLQKILKPLASLRLAVVLMALCMVLIYAGTWAQIDTGIWQVQRQYFHCLFTWIDFKTLLPRPAPGHTAVGGGFPFPGGYLLGTMLLVNLIAAHFVRYKNASLGIVCIHTGLVMLLVGESLTSVFAREGQLTLEQGVPTYWAQDVRESELAIIDPSAADHDDVVTIDPAQLLKTGADVRDARLPFDIHVDDYYPNSTLLGPMQPAPTRQVPATAGEGLQVKAVGKPQVSGTSGETVDLPSAYLTFTHGGQNLGTYLLSSYIDEPQQVQVDGKVYNLQLRFRRYYKPYTIELLKFNHEKYTGTETPRDYSSVIHFTDPTRHEDREVKIWMNHPLYYGGETFYQSSFRGDNVSILQVVKNPAKWLPYVACGIGALGLLLHFGELLLKFLRRNVLAESPAGERRLAWICGLAGVLLGICVGGGLGLLHLSTSGMVGTAGVVVGGALGGALGIGILGAAIGGLLQSLKSRSLHRSKNDASGLGGLVLPMLVACCGLMFVASLFFPRQQDNGWDLHTAGLLPINDGRIQPLDSLARNSLRAISGYESAEYKDPQKSPPDNVQKLPAIQWFLDVLSNSQRVGDYRVIRIDHPDVKSGLHLEPSRKLFSYNELLPSSQILETQWKRANEIEAAARNDYERKIIELTERLSVYNRLMSSGQLFLMPPLSSGEKWQQLEPAFKVLQTDAAHASPAAVAWQTILSSYVAGDTVGFNRSVNEYQHLLDQRSPALASSATFESTFNSASPFFWSMFLYVGVFVLAACSWLGFRRPLARSAFGLLLVAVGFHTFGLAARVYISGHAPVTNLYSSAVFIAWAGALLCVFLEMMFRNGVATALAAVIAIPSLIIAYCLAGEGDTMAPLQAVLDTNLWLWTHVICVTLGYAATFVAGIIAILFVLVGFFTPFLEETETRKNINRMIYGIICFAVTFSFVGTVLGGIWADQSWGRFWGWDPKENGAVLIVLWTGLILHARWCGWAKERGVAALAIFGNIVTSWSWFGTNMLGVGLHSYGFMDRALQWLLAFVVTQLLLVVLASMPLKLWRSYAGSDEEWE